MSTLTIVSLQTGLPRTLGTVGAAEPMDREWTTGFFKEPVTGLRQVTALGIEGDGQADLIHHGGPDKAINVYPSEHYAGWAGELGLALQAGSPLAHQRPRRTSRTHRTHGLVFPRAG
ncbi:MAG: hypothetical protein Q8M07_10365 [Prosthecobacter sp.]|nr:hypothetical protein [Prosthecobacter sp.]